jgi:hypothetical protein
MQGESSRTEQTTQPQYRGVYIIVGFVACFLSAYALTVVFTGVPEWVAPDSLGPRLIGDMASHWQSWVGGVFGAWFGYKVGKA